MAVQSCFWRSSSKRFLKFQKISLSSLWNIQSRSFILFFFFTECICIEMWCSSERVNSLINEIKIFLLFLLFRRCVLFLSLILFLCVIYFDFIYDIASEAPWKSDRVPKGRAISLTPRRFQHSIRLAFRVVLRARARARIIRRPRFKRPASGCDIFMACF